MQADEENEEMAVEGDAEVPAPAADHEEPRPDCGQRYKPSGTLAMSVVTVNFDFLNFWQDPTRKQYSSQYIIQLHCLLALTRIS